MSAPLRRHWAELYRDGATVASIAERYGRSPNFVRLSLLAAGVRLRGLSPPLPAIVGRCRQCRRPIRRDEPVLHRRGKPVLHRRHFGDGRPGKGFRFGTAEFLGAAGSTTGAGGPVPAVDPEEESRATGRGMLIKEMNWRGLL